MDKKKAWLFTIMVLAAGLTGNAVDLWSRSAGTLYPTNRTDVLNFTSTANNNTFFGDTTFKKFVYISSNKLKVNNLNVCLSDGSNCPAIASGSSYNYKVLSSYNNLTGYRSITCAGNTRFMNITENGATLSGLCQAVVAVESDPIAGVEVQTINRTERSDNASAQSEIKALNRTIIAVNLTASKNVTLYVPYSKFKTNISLIPKNVTLYLPYTSFKTNATLFSKNVTLYLPYASFKNNASLFNKNVTSYLTISRWKTNESLIWTAIGLRLLTSAFNFSSYTSINRLNTNLSLKGNVKKNGGNNITNANIWCKNITGGTDADYCTDATSSGSPVNTTTQHAGDVTGTYNSIVIKNNALTVTATNVTNVVNGGAVFQQFNVTRQIVTSVSATAPSSVNTLTITSGKVFSIECMWVANSTAATVGIQPNLTVTGTFTQVYLSGQVIDSTGASVFPCGTKGTSKGLACLPLGASTAGTSQIIWLSAYGISSAAGTFTASVKSETGARVNVMPGSYCRSVES